MRTQRVTRIGLFNEKYMLQKFLFCFDENMVGEDTNTGSETLAWIEMIPSEGIL